MVPLRVAAVSMGRAARKARTGPAADGSEPLGLEKLIK
jgi:hypothetical protein